jgi:hypothetical protein
VTTFSILGLSVVKSCSCAPVASPHKVWLYSIVFKVVDDAQTPLPLVPYRKLREYYRELREYYRKLREYYRKLRE